MPLYMDVHNLQGATTAQIDQAHAADLKEQGKYGVKYLKYWFNESHGKAFCLVDAPSPEAAQLVHRQRSLEEDGNGKKKAMVPIIE